MQRTHDSGSGARRRTSQRHGFTIVELLVSFSALLIVLLGFSRMLLSSRLASATTHEATLAKEAARMQIEVMQGMAFGAIYSSFDGAAANFAVRGLEAPDGDPDGLPGKILFPEHNGTLSELCTSQPQYGWPMDLDGDGLTNTADVSATYRVLPVVVRVEWRGQGCNGKLEFKTVIGGF